MAAGTGSRNQFAAELEATRKTLVHAWTQIVNADEREGDVFVSFVTARLRGEPIGTDIANLAQRKFDLVTTMRQGAVMHTLMIELAEEQHLLNVETMLALADGFAYLNHALAREAVSNAREEAHKTLISVGHELLQSLSVFVLRADMGMHHHNPMSPDLMQLLRQIYVRANQAARFVNRLIDDPRILPIP